MAENKLAVMMHAFALGCLNTEDYQKLSGYLASNGEYPYQELGEFQNLAALIPSVLGYENPPKEVKESIARQLYYIKDEAKEEKRIPVPVSDWMEPDTKDTEAEEDEDLNFQQVESPVTEEEVPVYEQEQVLPEAELKTPEEPEPETIKEEYIEDQKPSLQNEETLEAEVIEEAELNPEPEAAEKIISPEPEDQKIELKVKREEKKPDEGKAAAEKLYVEKKPDPVSDKKPAESVKEVKEVDSKPPRSLGDFLAGAEIKEEAEIGKIEFEDYFVEARKAEINKRQAARSKPETPDAEVIKKERPIRELPKIDYSERTRYRGGGSSGKTIFIILLIIIAAGGAYYYFNSEIQLFKSDKEKMAGEIEALTETTVNDKEILRVLSMKDSRIINLYGSSTNAYSFGKVIYSPEAGKGFINVTSLPELNSSKSYQFWISTGGRNYPVHKFTTARMMDYYPFTIARVSLSQPMRVFLTEEPLAGSQTPSRVVLVSGSN